ncbi:protein of unknown function [Bradyrhizobium sp. ORS 285]|nr:protein of unknown function [Bradyrhizobium sp. ORS 285]
MRSALGAIGRRTQCDGIAAAVRASVARSIGSRHIRFHCGAAAPFFVLIGGDARRYDHSSSVADERHPSRRVSHRGHIDLIATATLHLTTKTSSSLRAAVAASQPGRETAFGKGGIRISG